MTWTNPPPAVPPADGKPKHRIFLWIFLAVQILFLLWIIVGAARGGSDCESLKADLCNDAQNVGKAIGVGLIIFLWAAVDVILGFSYLVYRLASRK